MSIFTKLRLGPAETDHRRVLVLLRCLEHDDQGDSPAPGIVPATRRRASEPSTPMLHSER